MVVVRTTGPGISVGLGVGEGVGVTEGVGVMVGVGVGIGIQDATAMPAPAMITKINNALGSSTL
jgi:hypothetical protein